jgi:hypothetical protein
VNRKEKKEAEFKKSQEGLKQAAKDWNNKTPAQKKAARRWGKNKN